MKNYTVYYVIKANRNEYLCEAAVEAQNAKEACRLVKEEVRERTGRNAFRPTTNPNDIDFDWFKRNGNYRPLRKD